MLFHQFLLLGSNLSWTLHRVTESLGNDSRSTVAHRIRRTFDPSSPMAELSRPETQAGFTYHNSILSETAVLGFEHGKSLVTAQQLVIRPSTYPFGYYQNV